MEPICKIFAYLYYVCSSPSNVSDPTPFLFVGRLLDSPMVAITPSSAKSTKHGATHHCSGMWDGLGGHRFSGCEQPNSRCGTARSQPSDGCSDQLDPDHQTRLTVDSKRPPEPGDVKVWFD